MFVGQTLKVSVGENQIAELCFDAQDASVNKFDAATTEELQRALALLAVQDDIRGLIVSSAKSVFVVGADITEFVEVFGKGKKKITAFAQKQNDNFSKLEDLPFPTVAVINGYALGGGLELALACDYRIASEQAVIGLPETGLGIIPGWGGTVRLTRLAGAEVAANWICGGKHHDTKSATEAGVIDQVVKTDKLVKTAVDTIEQCSAGKQDYLAHRKIKLDPVPVGKRELNKTRKEVSAAILAGRAKSYPALEFALQAIFDAAVLPRKDALAVESKAFANVAVTSEAAAMVGNFLADQLLARKSRALEKQASKETRQVAVLGAGIMGGGIAYTAALNGLSVRVKDIQQEGIDLAMTEADKLLSRRVSKGRMTKGQKSEVLTNIDGQLSYEGFDQADMVIEAVVENADIKGRVLAEVEQQLPEDAVIASNTSTISISSLAKALERRENFCGMHFFNPVHAMPLVEVIRGEKTSDDTIARTVALANQMRKKAVVVNDCPGFLVNRVLFPYFAGFGKLLADGVHFTTIDAVMEAWGWPMGPAHLADVVGIDTMVHCESVLEEGYPDRMSKMEAGPMDLMLAADRLGQKNGKGFYQYQKDKQGRIQKLADPDADVVLSPLCTTHFEIDEDDIVTRMMIPMATEMARCLEEGIVDSAAEADLALLYGLGFPDFRGGIFRWMDGVGMPQLVDITKPFEGLGALYESTEGMLELANKDGRYYS